MHSRLRRAFLTATALLPGIAGAATPCSDVPRMHALDFWLGHWSVHSQDERVGDNLIERVLGGCAVTERWKDVRGREGLSLFYYDVSQDLWKQIWVTDDALRPGGLKEKLEQKELTAPGRMRFQGRYAGPSGATILDRTTLTSKADGSLHQLIEISTDEGRSWRPTFDSVHRRLIPTNAISSSRANANAMSTYQNPPISARVPGTAAVRPAQSILTSRTTTFASRPIASAIFTPP
jgi:hypothetical protein